MDYVYAVISLLGGVGALLIGFKLLSDSIEKLANSRLKRIFKRTSKNRFIGIGIGTATTAIIQSSSATTVMVVGFVNAGIMTLFQATAVIMGANIGTTITAQIVALNSFDISKFALIFTFIGVFMQMLGKREKIRVSGMALAGLGLVFLSLSFMSSSMSVFRESGQLTSLLTKANNPFLLLFIGILLTCIMQSSSAVTAIIISMAGSGIIIGSDCNAVLFVIMGTNIGTCITALLSSIGANTNARRASLIHLMFNVFGTLIFVCILLIWKNFMNDTLAKVFDHPTTQIAMFHTLFNVTATLIFFPFINGFVKLSQIIIKDKKEVRATTYIDERFLKTPAIALGQVMREIENFGNEIRSLFKMAIQGFVSKDLDVLQKVSNEIKRIEKSDSEIVDYLIKISSEDITKEDEKMISALHQIIGDFTRVSEIADNIIKYTQTSMDKNIVFSKDVYESINLIQEKIELQFYNVMTILKDGNYEIIGDVNEIENEIDAMRKSLIDDHIKRLEDGRCKPQSNAVFINLISNMERAGDHLNYAAQALCNIL